MPPPGGGGGANIGFVKEKLDPWEVGGKQHKWVVWTVVTSITSYEYALDSNLEAS